MASTPKGAEAVKVLIMLAIVEHMRETYRELAQATTTTELQAAMAHQSRLLDNMILLNDF